MENMPYRVELDLQTFQAPIREVTRNVEATSTDWQNGLPVLGGAQVTLRELRASDAPSLFALLTTEEVARFISPPPTTVEGFEKFIAWTIRQRTAGTYACFAVTLKGYDTAVGIFQLRAMEPGFGTGEWGFAIGSPFWGTGRVNSQSTVSFLISVRVSVRVTVTEVRIASSAVPNAA